MLATVGWVLAGIVAGVVALVLIVALVVLGSHVYVDTDVHVDAEALAFDGRARVRWLAARARLELPSGRARIRLLGIPVWRGSLGDLAPRRRAELVPDGDAAAGTTGDAISPGGEPDADASHDAPPSAPKGRPRRSAKRRPRRRLPRFGLARRALRTARRAVRVHHLDGDLVIATPDPVLTGQLLATALLGRDALRRLAPADRHEPSGPGLRIRPDFSRDLPSARLDMTAAIGVGTLALAAWRAARAFDLVRLPGRNLRLPWRKKGP